MIVAARADNDKVIGFTVTPAFPRWGGHPVKSNLRTPTRCRHDSNQAAVVSRYSTASPQSGGRALHGYANSLKIR